MCACGYPGGRRVGERLHLHGLHLEPALRLGSLTQAAASPAQGQPGGKIREGGREIGGVAASISSGERPPAAEQRPRKQQRRCRVHCLTCPAAPGRVPQSSECHRAASAAERAPIPGSCWLWLTHPAACRRAASGAGAGHPLVSQDLTAVRRPSSSSGSKQRRAEECHMCTRARAHKRVSLLVVGGTIPHFSASLLASGARRRRERAKPPPQCIGNTWWRLAQAGARSGGSGRQLRLQCDAEHVVQAAGEAERHHARRHAAGSVPGRPGMPACGTALRGSAAFPPP